MFNDFCGVIFSTAYITIHHHTELKIRVGRWSSIDSRNIIIDQHWLPYRKCTVIFCPIRSEFLGHMLGKWYMCRDHYILSFPASDVCFTLIVVLWCSKTSSRSFWLCSPRWRVFKPSNECEGVWGGWSARLQSFIQF